MEMAEMWSSPARATLIEGLDVLEDVLEVVAAAVDLCALPGVEHEGVIRIGRVAEG